MGWFGTCHAANVHSAGPDARKCYFGEPVDQRKCCVGMCALADAVLAPDPRLGELVSVDAIAADPLTECARPLRRSFLLEHEDRLFSGVAGMGHQRPSDTAARPRRANERPHRE